MRGLCETRPRDWWELGDGGNRLALMLCRVCPARAPCAAGACREAGVIRAGVAYGDRGGVLPICACGYPNTKRPPKPGQQPSQRCVRCDVPRIRICHRRTYDAAYYLLRRARRAAA